MSDNALNKLIDGYRAFRQQYLKDQYVAYRTWARKKQKPRVMMIACSDSRVNPSIVTHASLGEVFMVENVANLVPPYKPEKDSHHSTSAALEYAITFLEVEHIIIFGHSGCGGIKALMDDTTCGDDTEYSFIGPWVGIASEAKAQVLANHPACSKDEQAALCERASLLMSLENIRTFPWAKAALGANKLTLHAWHFDVETGEIEQYVDAENNFVPLLNLEDKVS